MGVIKGWDPLTVKKMGAISTYVRFNLMAIATFFTLGFMTTDAVALHCVLNVWQMNKTSKQAHPLIRPATDPIDCYSVIGSGLIDRMTFRAATRRKR